MLPQALQHPADPIRQAIFEPPGGGQLQAVAGGAREGGPAADSEAFTEAQRVTIRATALPTYRL